MALIVKNDGIGDLVLASGVIASFASNSGHEVDLVTCEQNAPIAERIPGVREVIPISRDGLGHKFRTDGLLYGPNAVDFRARRVVSGRRYDVAISLRRFIRASTVEVMSWVDAEDKIACWEFATNFDPKDARPLESWRRYHNPLGPLWEPQYYREAILTQLGLGVRSSPNLRGPSSENRDRPRDETLVGVLVSGASSRWQDLHWEELCASLLDGGFRVRVFCDADSRMLANRIIENHNGKVEIFDSAPLTDLEKSLSECGSLIGNDTGIVHFAQTLDIPTVVVSGGGTFGRFFPWPLDKLKQLVVVSPMACFDCDWRCPQTTKEKCLRDIKPHQVMEAFRFLPKVEGPGYWKIHQREVSYVVGWKRTAEKYPPLRTV